MDKPTRIFVAMAVIAGLFVVAFFTIGPPGEKVYASPQEAFNAAKKASSKDDVKAFCQCITNGSRDIHTAIGVVLLFDVRQKIQKAGEEGKSQTRAIDELFAKHRLSGDFLAGMQGKLDLLFEEKAGPDVKLEVANALLLPVRDKDAFAADLHRSLEKFTKRSPLAMIEVFREASLSDVKTDGATAQGKMTVEGGRGMPISFRKQGEGWRIDLIASESRPQMPPHGFQ